MRECGYRIIPVNLSVSEVISERNYPSLYDLSEAIDLVDVFRESSHVVALVEDCIALKLPALWLRGRRD